MRSGELAGVSLRKDGGVERVLRGAWIGHEE